jgi:hypothetical protein
MHRCYCVAVVARSAGDRFQFENTWRVGDPLPLGLYQVGDSSLP